MSFSFYSYDDSWYLIPTIEIQLDVDRFVFCWLKWNFAIDYENIKKKIMKQS